MKIFLRLWIFLLFVTPLTIKAQCAGGETEVLIIVHTDKWGTEVSWSLTGPGGSPSYITGGPYTDVETHIEESVCVPIDAELVFSIADSYGDGICSGSGDGYYSVSVYDFIYASGCDYGKGDTTTFNASVPPNENAELVSLGLGKYMAVGDNLIKGTFRNQGLNTITSIDISWQEEGGGINTESLSGIDVLKYENYDFTHNTVFNVTEAQVTKKLKVWLSNPNGLVDENISNDTIEVSDIFILSQAVKRRGLIEHYTNAGCPPCAEQNPILEALLNQGDNPDKIAHIAYHTSGPGYDPMNVFNASYDQGSARATYYNITGVPTAVFGGKIYSGSPVGINQQMIDEEYNILGEFKIVPEITYQNDSLFIDVEITSLKAQTSGALKTFVVLIEDKEYDSPPGTNGEKLFPNVMRYMLTGIEGEDIGLPVADEVKNISCKMPFHEDIGQNLQLIIFVQNTTDKEMLMVYQLNEDFVPPLAVFNPSKNIEGIKVDADLHINFKDKVRLLNDELITNPDTLVFLKSGSIDGEDVVFSSSITDDKNILINPTDSLEYDTEYFYGYKAYIEDWNDFKAQEDIAKFRTEVKVTTDINQIKSDYSLTLYPNPANESLNINLNLLRNSETKIRIYNQAGQLVKFVDQGELTKGDHNIKIDLRKLNNGLYFVSLDINNQKLTQKIQVVK
jgi:thiol-disulfide isomerase/thioredoxin